MLKIGIFDSGLGGLTVARAIKDKYPSVSIVYIGDTARVPWGIRSEKVIKNFSLQLLKFLEKKSVSAIVVACHTASAVAIPFLKKYTKLAIYGVIEPAAEAVVSLKAHRVGILATPATIKSGSWERAIKSRNEAIQVFSNKAPLLVPIVEEGLERHNVANLMVLEYLKPLLAKKIDTLVLASTHYPHLLPVFQKLLPKGFKIVNPGVELANRINFKNKQGRDPRDDFYFTDLSDRVKSRLFSFYGYEIKGKVKEVDIEKL